MDVPLTAFQNGRYLLKAFYDVHCKYRNGLEFYAFLNFRIEIKTAVMMFLSQKIGQMHANLSDRQKDDKFTKALV